MMTDEEIREKGMKILNEHLGDLETTRFLAQIMREGRDLPRNYTEWRHENLFKGMSAKEIHAAAIEYAKTHHLE